jgi:hypothetical protein
VVQYLAIVALKYIVWYSRKRRVTVGIFSKTGDHRGGLPTNSTASFVPV